MSEHFVVTIDVKKVSTHPDTGDKRKISTISRITISGSSLDNAIAKSQSHMALIEDGGDVDARDGNVR